MSQNDYTSASWLGSHVPMKWQDIQDIIKSRDSFDDIEEKSESRIIWFRAVVSEAIKQSHSADVLESDIIDCAKLFVAPFIEREWKLVQLARLVSDEEMKQSRFYSRSADEFIFPLDVYVWTVCVDRDNA